MIILVHVLLALSSLILSSINLLVPSQLKLKTSYGLAVATLLTGALLIVVNNANVLRTCMTGVIFFAVVTVLNEVARKRLAPELSE